jgi:hypothetical protein
VAVVEVQDVYPRLYQKNGEEVDYTDNNKRSRCGLANDALSPATYPRDVNLHRVLRRTIRCVQELCGARSDQPLAAPDQGRRRLGDWCASRSLVLVWF